MLYANIKFDGNRNGSVNIGDDLQILAIEYLYQYMGIDYKDVVRIRLSELSTYTGEYAILPVSFPLYGYREGTYIKMFSPKIIPVFLGLSIMSNNISKEECDYLRRYEPIGCRDYYTVKILRNHNILAYLNGCMTVTLPQRDIMKNYEQKTVYLVDIPTKYTKYIPDQLLKGCVIKSQILEECVDPEKTMRERLDEYEKNASVVITTRLHCVLPCLAMGIPVVFMKEKYSFRFSAISRFIHVYTEEEFDKIDFSPKPVSYESKKKSILALAAKRITETYNRYREIFDLSNFYETNNNLSTYYIEHFDNVIEDVLPFF